MQKINWNSFKAKFDGQEQKSFEWLCYLLFCDEFNIKTGIFRYKNQAGIETEPIQHNGKLVGFQAKFYGTGISSNKEDIKKSIRTAKNKNDKLDKILFYINQEFSESSKKNKKEPAYKTEIENYAKSKNIEIEWRVPSHFEIQLTRPQNVNFAKYFFSTDKSIIDFIGELILHTESILKVINSRIKFKDNEIKIDRSQQTEILKSVLSKSTLVILSGKAGVGKTAIIKDFYDQIKEKVPFFVFKAVEFNISNINQLFANYKSFTLKDFIEEHQGIEEKYIVIDSAEKLSDIEDTDAFTEFLSTLLSNNWKIIFTTRYSYLDDLKFQLTEIYRVNFEPVNINNLSLKELAELAEKHKFSLPQSTRLSELLQNPFYLNEYLQNYEIFGNTISFLEFKNILWDKQISKTAHKKNNIHIKREESFLKIANKRAIEGHFFVEANDCDNIALQALEADEIIKYDSMAGGYFITHDIYEEWALDKIIERNFIQLQNLQTFFQNIGSSLPIRRAFRGWLSGKLLDSKDEVKSLIENTIIDDEIKSYWKDEIYVSVMLSNYAEVFFELFENRLLEDNQKLLMRIVFLLRIACKELDETILNLLCLKKTGSFSLSSFFTKPKGIGWDCVIDFIYRYKTNLGLQNINIILPLLEDWNGKNAVGDTTRKTSLIALFYYDEISKNDYKYQYNRIEKQLIKVILQGVSEIVEELKAIFDEVIARNLTKHTDKYYEIVTIILTSMTDGIGVISKLPGYIIKLADIFWFESRQDNHRGGYHYHEVETSFGLSESHDFNYFPASAFQTPQYWLLKFAAKEAVDFILSFTNKCVECYVESRFNKEIEEVEVFFDGIGPVKQYISNRLWNMYRGTQVSTHLLESIHMALEKWLLENAKSMSKETLEHWCLYLLRNSRSASITSVVTSVVLANSSKLFNVAKILFKTKKFFIYDTHRMVLDLTSKSLYSIGFGLKGRNELYDNERIKTCDESHRKMALEHIALYYQVFRTEDEHENEYKERQEIIWKILDDYYKELPDSSLSTEADKTWGLFLARMDKRKMHLKIKKQGGQTLIEFNPEIDAELEKHSKKAMDNSAAMMKYSALRMWSEYRFRNEEGKFNQYQQYENNTKLVIKETKEIVKRLKNNICPNIFSVVITAQNKTEEDYCLHDRSIPAYACSVLLRDFFDKLNSKEREFCKKIIIKYASIPVRNEKYYYQISDGVEPSIAILPDLIKHFQKDKESVMFLLLLLLLNPWQEISLFATKGILWRLWEIDFNAAHTIFLGYLLLKPEYDKLSTKMREENYQKNIYEVSEIQIVENFIIKCKSKIENIISGRITYAELGDLKTLDLRTLMTAFELVPLETKNEDHKKFINITLPVFCEKLFQDDDKIEYTLKHRILNKLAYFVLNSTKEEIGKYLKPFVENLGRARDAENFFQEFVSVEDILNKYEEFWVVWYAFYNKIVELYKKPCSRYYTEPLLHNYLLAWSYWKDTAKEWHSLKEREKLFYKKIAEDIGHHPAVLYSISKVLNDIGSNFIEDGIVWISDILQKNKQLALQELEVNTIYYIENVIRRYVSLSRQKIKTSLQIKNHVLVILNFLIERGSVAGYLLRENIL
ncbi:MAG: AVAST type 4 anti-phage nuclease Avs4 [Sedimentisphaerales bacterium]